MHLLSTGVGYVVKHQLIKMTLELHHVSDKESYFIIQSTRYLNG